ncbi:MAG: hypothetical protein IT376_06505 [Polyangiaceae bacterium]|nr:hypothetical protein [Polyangiaceae bacterium]
MTERPTSIVSTLGHAAASLPRGQLLRAADDLLDRAARLDPATLRRHQGRQLALVLAHARATVPFDRERLRAIRFDPERHDWAEVLRDVPPLDRARAQEVAPQLVSLDPPPGHAPNGYTLTSGSTGRPLRVLGTPAVALVNLALDRRFHRWWRRDPGRRAAIVTNVLDPARGRPPDGDLANGWFPGERCGETRVLSVAVPIDQQLAWLGRLRPSYLVTFPSSAAELLRHALRTGAPHPGVEHLCTSSEPVPEHLRALATLAWDVRVAATYSASEVGPIAFEHPEGPGYFVQAENVLVEVVDDAGRPCAPGELGRVLITTLHNFAMPLVRYELGDRAAWGAPWAGLPAHPVLERVVGRVRHLARLADGSRAWPYFRHDRLVRIAPFRQWQLVQSRPGEVVARVVATRPLTDAERAEVASVACEFVPFDRVSVEEVAALPRGPGGKYEDFVSSC